MREALDRFEIEGDRTRGEAWEEPASQRVPPVSLDHALGGELLDLPSTQVEPLFEPPVWQPPASAVGHPPIQTIDNVPQAAPPDSPGYQSPFEDAAAGPTALEGARERAIAAARVTGRAAVASWVFAAAIVGRLSAALKRWRRHRAHLRALPPARKRRPS